MSVLGRDLGGDKAAVVPAAEVRTYYDRPVIKPPVWKPEVPWYFFFGGLAGASSLLAAAADARGDADLARTARRVAGVGAAVSPVLLVADLGVPSRFANMLRVFRPTSPLNMGSWLLTVYVPSALGGAALGELGRLPRLRMVVQAGAALGGLGMATYPAVLVADTAVPVWHEARRELPFVFAGTAAATAGAAAAMLGPAGASSGRRLVVLGTVIEQAAVAVMERRLGELVEPYHEGRAGRYAAWAKRCAIAGAATMALGGRRRSGVVAGGALVLAGGLLERWAVFRAGFQSAQRPADTVRPQRERVTAATDRG